MTKMSRRQVLAGGAAVSAAVALAACGEKKDEAGGSAPKKDGEKIELTYWHRLPDKENMIKVEEIVKKWNDENPDIQVKTVKFDGNAEDSYSKIKQAVESGNAPDLSQVGYGEIPSEYVAQHLEDITKEVQEGGYEKNYAAGPMGQCKLGDVIVGLPQDTGPLVYVYDKAAFDEIGIKAPTTWDELREAAKKAKEKGKYICTWQGDETRYRMSGLAAAAGGTWFKPEGDAWKINIADEASSKVAAIQQSLLDEDLALKLSDGRWGKNDFPTKLKDGSLIGMVAAGWEPSFMLGDLGKEETQWQVTYLPQFTPGKNSTGADGGSAVCVIKGCKHKPEAVKFANWFNTQIDGLVSQGLVVAANTGTPKTPEDIKKLWGGQDVYAFLAEANATMNEDFPYAPTWPEISQTMNQVGGEVTQGKAKVTDIFAKAQETALSSMKTLNIPVK